MIDQSIRSDKSTVVLKFFAFMSKEKHESNKKYVMSFILNMQVLNKVKFFKLS